jgi:hypothetical protein
MTSASGNLGRSQGVFFAVNRHSGGTAHKLDKLRKRGFSRIPLPIDTRELTALKKR